MRACCVLFWCVSGSNGIISVYGGLRWEDILGLNFSFTLRRDDKRAKEEEKYLFYSILDIVSTR